MTKHTKLFYKVVARLRIAKPDYLAIDAIRKRFKIGYLRSLHVYQELEKAEIIKEMNPKKEKSNIDWNKVEKIRVPKIISESVKKMKPERVYPFS